jgi:aspartyl-tRNA(Asn)/glutamyl-tRNA(Gln) amidotransferase subunit A
MFKHVDVVAAPTVAVAAPAHEEVSDPRQLARLYRMGFTGYWNAVGCPALAVPMGYNGDGLPLSLQLAARPFEEATVLRAGDAFQQVTDWHLGVPPLVGGVSAGGLGLVTEVHVADRAPAESVEATLGVAGLSASPDEVTALALSWPGLKESIEALYAVRDTSSPEPVDASEGLWSWRG